MGYSREMTPEIFWHRLNEKLYWEGRHPVKFAEAMLLFRSNCSLLDALDKVCSERNQPLPTRAVGSLRWLGE